MNIPYFKVSLVYNNDLAEYISNEKDISLRVKSFSETALCYLTKNIFDIFDIFDNTKY